MAALAAFSALALAACNATDAEVARKANKPLTPQMVSLLSQKDMAPASPMLVRIFKEEAELEVWKVTSDGSFALLKTYPICRWSGELGPKVRMGDRQAPEGFYAITPGQMNPNSNYYLSFNLGFPNAFDKAYGRTGEFLMVHGDCSSAGCYAMTDEQISEIFSLARESFAGGQRSFQVQAYPFRMTPKNLAKHRNNPNMAFWRNLKQGYDHFEVTKQEPKVNVCGRAYVFDAEPVPGRAFDANQSCPPYQVAPQVAAAVAEKQRADDAQVAALAPSSPVVPVRTGSDGGMHPVFLAKLKERESGQMSFSEAPGTLPEYVNPPKVTDASLAAAAARATSDATPAPVTTGSVAPAAVPAATASVGGSAAPLPPVKPSASTQKPSTVASMSSGGAASGYSQ
ncbi:murein L,D-transpeptidase family protein [Xanthobacter autotrophicus DSM 431]